MSRGGRKPGSKDRKPRSRAGWTPEKRAAVSKRLLALTDAQVQEAAHRISAPGGPTISQLALQTGASSVPQASTW